MTDTFFNHDAARWAREHVMKMDEDEALAFVQFATYDILMDDIRANRRTIDSKVQEIHKRLSGQVARGVVSKTLTGDVADASAALVTLVSKADPWAGESDPSWVRRDERGRFSTVERRIRHGKTRPLSRRQQKRISIPKPTNEDNSRGVHLSPQQRARFQQEYLQLADTLDAFADAGVMNPTMVIEDKRTGKRRTVQVNDARPDFGWNPATQTLVAVRGQKQGDAGYAGAFNLVGALGGSPGLSGAVAGAVDRTDRKTVNRFSENWHKDASGDSATNARTYRRVEAGSRLLADVAPDGTKTAAAGRFGEFVGQYGPEAEKVVGPKMRRTAYRYRGTERTPEPDLIKARNAEIIARSKSGGAESITPEVRAQASINTAINHFLDPSKSKLPTLRLAELQRKSGKIPPSEGVIINHEGKIVTQAVGFADDHYLPFNLKNLKGLQGGHYVRTRTKGGPTTEDIYTGLVAGARSVTVVSNSGVFTVTFDDEFRGTRRYNDKAAGMVERYAKTLDAIKEGQIEREKLSPEIRASIREEVESEMPEARQSEIAAEIDARVKEYKETPSLTKDEVKQIEETAMKSAKNEREYKSYRSQLLDAAMENKRSRFYQLDGEGYATALEAMKEQFPYYIGDITFAHRHEALKGGERTDRNNRPAALDRFAPGKDDGYVKAKYNRPDAVLEGYYDEEIAGRGVGAGAVRGKTRASQTNYQNWANNSARRSYGTESDAKSGDDKPKDPQRIIRGAQAVREQAELERKALQVYVDKLYAGVDAEDLRKEAPLVGEAHKDLDSILSDKAKRQRLEDQLDRLYSRIEAAGDADKYSNYKKAWEAAKGRLGGEEWTKDKLGERGKQPWKFPGVAYEPGATAQEIHREFSKVTRDAGLRVQMNEANDETLAKRAEALGRASNFLQGSGDDYDILAELVKLDLPPDIKPNDILRKMKQGSREEMARDFAKKAEAYQRLRTLQANQPKTPPTPDAAALPDKAESGSTKKMDPVQRLELLAKDAERYDREIADFYRTVAWEKKQQMKMPDYDPREGIAEALRGLSEEKRSSAREIISSLLNEEQDE